MQADSTEMALPCVLGEVVKRTNMIVINHPPRLLAKKSYKKLKNGQRNRECVNKNAKLTLTNP